MRWLRFLLDGFSAFANALQVASYFNWSVAGAMAVAAIIAGFVAAIPWFWILVGAAIVGYVSLLVTARLRRSPLSRESRTQPSEQRTLPLPKTLKEYFETDFSNCTKMFNSLQILRPVDPPVTFEVPWQVCMEDNTGAKFVSFYISVAADTFDICKALADAVSQILDHEAKSVQILTMHPGDTTHTDSKDMAFSGRVYLYHENPLSLTQLGALESIYKAKNLNPQFRGPTYPTGRWLQEKAST